MATKPASLEGVQPGQRWNYEHGTITVMAVVGSYAMVRYPRAGPFAVLKKELQTKWTRAEKKN